MARLGDMLVSEGLLTQEQLDSALSEQKSGGGFLGEVLVRKRFLTEEQLVEVLVRQTGSPAVDPATIEFTSELSSLVRASLARKHMCVPVKKTGKILHVAMANPQDDQAIEALAFQSSCTVKTMVAGRGAIEKALEKFYVNGTAAAPEAPAKAKSSAKPAEGKAASKAAPSKLPDLKSLDGSIQSALEEMGDEGAKEGPAETVPVITFEADGKEAPVVRMVNGLILKSVLMRASDVHIEPMEEKLRVRFRIDGALVEVLSLPVRVKAGMISRIKILSNMDIAERRIPQDGRIKLQLTGDQTIELRVNSLPSIYGEKIVMRLLGQGQLSKNIRDLAFRDRALQLVEESVNNPYGMILVTGPTGSGKTTTLYTILNQLNTGDVNIVTAEDPVEYQLAGITQVNVRASIGFTFDSALRAFLRQDPDIILVGEMRDFETAQIGTKAALTGHLVLSTLHTNDCPSTVVRLVDMGIEPYLVSSAVKIVIAQRLVRKICQGCKEEISVEEAAKSNLDEETLSSIEHMFKGKGCEACHNMGYRGRKPVFEVMAVKSKEMKRVITEGGTEIQVAQVARREGMQTLKEEAIACVNAGETTLEEAIEIMAAE